MAEPATTPITYARRKPARPAPSVPAAGAGPALATLEGSVERITFLNEETGYTVLKLQPKGRTHLVTVVGNLPSVQPGENLRLSGLWTTHPVHGKQFEARDCLVVLPATAEGIRKYLGSGLIKGVGPVTANRIVAAFGERALDVIEHEPERLKEVPGIGAMRYGAIARAWQEQRAIKEVMLFLADHGVSTSLAVRIYKTFGNDAIRVTRDDPYRLAREVRGIGFKTADKIAAKMGIPKESADRAMAGLLHVLWEATEEGHVFLPESVLLERGAEVLERPAEALRAAVDALRAEKNVVVEEVEGERHVYPAPLAGAEIALARRLRTHLLDPADRLALFQGVDFERAFAWLRQQGMPPLSPRQQEAVQLALTRKVLVLTGGPGTGKTTTVRALIALLKAKRRSVLLCAPTGKAAKRLSEVTGQPAATIHRLLGLGFGGQVAHDADRPLDADAIVVDETSMVDLLLANQLVRAVPRGAHLVFVGDADQLPSVGAGDVIRDLVRSGAVPTVRLDVIFRQAEQSGIVVNAHRVLAGELPQLRGLADCFFLREEDPARCAELVRDLVVERLPRRYGFDPVRDIQVLTPLNRGALGAAVLNDLLQEALNPAGPRRRERRIGGRVFREGDKVLATRNDYAREVFNGDGGVIAALDLIDQTARVQLDDGRLVEYDFSDLAELVHAYAVSVHRSQGSEFPAVVLPLHTQHYLLLRRDLLYTAITRAKRLLVIVGSPRALAIAVKNAHVAPRYSGLERRLRPPDGSSPA